jgi:hypothetical protein
MPEPDFEGHFRSGQKGSIVAVVSNELKWLAENSVKISRKCVKCRQLDT